MLFFCFQEGGIKIKEQFYENLDRLRYKQILDLQDEHKKEFFDIEGCGLEIELGVTYEYRCRVFIETGLKKLKQLVGDRGKFVTDRSIGSFLNIEIVLKPFPRDALKELFNGITSIVAFYGDNIKFTENCGVHANFYADPKLKKVFYDLLANGRYDSHRFRHNKYKADFADISTNDDGTVKTYDEYLDFQHTVGAKYCGLNFLKDKLIEIRTLDLKWADVEYFYDLYDEAKLIVERESTDSDQAIKDK